MPKKRSRKGPETEKSITVGNKQEGFRNVPSLDFPGRRTMGPAEAIKTAKKRGTASKRFKSLADAVQAAKERSRQIPVSRVVTRAEEERTGKVIRSSKKRRR